MAPSPRSTVFLGGLAGQAANLALPVAMLLAITSFSVRAEDQSVAFEVGECRLEGRNSRANVRKVHLSQRVLQCNHQRHYPAPLHGRAHCPWRSITILEYFCPAYASFAALLIPTFLVN